MILMYHNIANEQSQHSLSKAYFEEHLKLLNSLKHFSVVSLSEYLNFEKPNQIALTFDDAYLSIETIVLPLIQKYHIPITVFVPTAHVGGFNQWDVEKGSERIDILQWESLRKLSKEPLMTFGSHGSQHVSIGEVGESCYDEEFLESKKILERELEMPVDYFAYPYGQKKNCVNKSEDFFVRMQYKAYLTTNWNRHNDKKNWIALNRIEILPTTDSEQLKAIITRKVDWKACKQKIKNLIK